MPQVTQTTWEWATIASQIWLLVRNKRDLVLFFQRTKKKHLELSWMTDALRTLSQKSIPSTGQLQEKLVQLRTKEVVDHAMSSLPIQYWKQLSLLRLENHINIFQSSRSLIVLTMMIHNTMELGDVMEDIWAMSGYSNIIEEPWLTKIIHTSQDRLGNVNSVKRTLQNM